MTLKKTEAVIMKQYDFSEADKLIRIYSLEQGKLNCIAKGVKKIKSKLRGSLLPFSYSSLILYKGKSLSTITSADVIENFSLLRKDLKLMAYTSYLLELLDSMVLEEEANRDIFVLLVGALHLLKHIPPKVAVKSFEIRLLRLLGYKPQIGFCLKCGREDTSYFFSSEQGGIFCRNCSSIHSNRSIEVRAGALKVLQQLDIIHWKKINRLKLSEKDNTELDILIDDYLKYILERRLLSREFLKTFNK